MEMNREELLRRLEALRPDIEKIFLQFGAHEPDWQPLEDTLLGDFMFMGYSDGIRMYKHRYTRRCLNLDADGRAYRYRGEKRRYEQTPLEDGTGHAFAEVESLVSRLRPGGGLASE